jgi:hypothetical protein
MFCGLVGRCQCLKGICFMHFQGDNGATYICMAAWKRSHLPIHLAVRLKRQLLIVPRQKLTLKHIFFFAFLCPIMIKPQFNDSV